MGRILKNYIFWAYKRGSVHYDVMVTLILLFIFLTPFFINFGDRPQSRLLPNDGVLVRSDGANEFTYDLGADQVRKADSGSLRARLLACITPITGPVEIDAYAPRKDSRGNLMGYRVWAHRTSPQGEKAAQ